MLADRFEDTDNGQVFPLVMARFNGPPVNEDGRDISESMQLMKVRSVICVPLISRSRVRGVIYLDSIKEPFGFREEDLHLLTALSSPAAIAIENDWLYSSLEKIVEDSTEVLERD